MNSKGKGRILKSNLEEGDCTLISAFCTSIAILSLLSIVLTSTPACQPAPRVLPTSTLTQTATAAPSPSRASTAAPSPRATPTPVPLPSATPVPSYTATPVPSPAAGLTRGPYLQSVTTDSIIVAWETDRASQGEVAYGETEAYGARVSSPAVGTRHAVTLTRLVTYTLYHYRVESGGAPLSGDAIFRTAPEPDQARFTFVAFGDTRTQHRVHQAVVERVVGLAPDFVLHTGDLVADGGSADEWATFFEIERELMAQAPVFPTLGNHERNSREYLNLFYLPGNERWYAFDYGNARFVCLQVDGYARFTPQSAQYVWLEETLATNTQPWLFVAFHVPPYTSAAGGQLEGVVRETLTPLFERYGVDVVLNGHQHNYERHEVNGVTYVVTAGGGAPLYAAFEREPTQAAFALAHHFVLLRIAGSRLQGTAISSTGAVLDKFERSAK